MAFEALARLRSVSAVADEMNVTPSAVSHRIRKLESEIGHPLFSRSDFRLTDVGSQYLAKVRIAIRALEKPSEFTIQNNRKLRLKISAPPTFSRQILLPMLGEFQSIYPNIDILISVTIPFFNISAEQADIDVRFGTLEEESYLQKVALMQDRIFPVCSPAYSEAHGLSGGFNTDAAITGCSLIRNPLEPWRTWFDFCGVSLSEPVEGWQFNDIGLSLEAAASGYGVALAREKLSGPWLQSGRLIPLSPKAVTSPHQHYLCWRSGTLERRECADFVEWLMASVPFQ
jgi:DNA-binding transcriptional LysR family regulator